MRDMIEWNKNAKSLPSAFGMSDSNIDYVRDKTKEIWTSSDNTAEAIVKAWNSDLSDIECALALFAIGTAKEHEDKDDCGDKNCQGHNRTRTKTKHIKAFKVENKEDLLNAIKEIASDIENKMKENKK